ncbi:hypothetical protein NC651_007559 [Populus alba x Populus x berolinensis]|nr:hypothetical protein NC651_007559 [Populus alba x Populus x berolinensis]
MLFKFPPEQGGSSNHHGCGRSKQYRSNPYRSLQDTPTWALATVCFIFIFTGIFIEYLIHLLSHVSQLLDATTNKLSTRKSCDFKFKNLLTIDCTVAVAEKKAERLPCMRLWRSSNRGMTSLISQSGVNQLNIFIFVIAIMQILYTVLTMALGRAKVT